MDSLSLFFILVLAVLLIGFGIAYYQERKEKHTH